MHTLQRMHNYDLAWRVIGHFLTHPDDFHQDDWHWCFGGWAARLSGWEPIDDPLAMVKDGHADTVEHIATIELGITDLESRWCLFASDNTMGELLTVLVRWGTADGIPIPNEIRAAHVQALREEAERA